MVGGNFRHPRVFSSSSIAATLSQMNLTLDAFDPFHTKHAGRRMLRRLLAGAPFSLPPVFRHVLLPTKANIEYNHGCFCVLLFFAMQKGRGPKTTIQFLSTLHFGPQPTRGAYSRFQGVKITLGPKKSGRKMFVKLFDPNIRKFRRGLSRIEFFGVLAVEFLNFFFYSLRISHRGENLCFVPSWRSEVRVDVFTLFFCLFLESAIVKIP